MRLAACILALVMCGISLGGDIAQYLQDISVTIASGGSTGSGVIVTRDLKTKAGEDKTEKVNFVWTAGHVVENLRSSRKVIDPNTGQEKTLVEFKDAKVVKELSENGRKIGEIQMDAAVIKYSDADNGEDLALLMMRKRGFIDSTANFYLKDDGVRPIGTRLFHVGSLLGQAGANSMTTGIVSQLGRVLPLGNRGGVVFDQTTVTAFPGSSGGGVFLADEGEDQGKYIGMLVRGAGEGFNLIVPIRRIKEWAATQHVEWAVDPSLAMPTLEEVLKLKAEDATGLSPEKEKVTTPTTVQFPYLIMRTSPIEIKEL